VLWLWHGDSLGTQEGKLQSLKEPGEETVDSRQQTEDSVRVTVNCRV
jgi:hypothetical protein